MAEMIRPKKAVNPAYLRQMPTRDEIDRFKASFATLLDKVADTDEEKQKGYLKDTLRDVFYHDHDIASHDNYDLVIRSGAKAKDPIAVLFEVKAPANTKEMVSRKSLAAKAMYELLLYYLRLRLDEGNNDLKYLVATNIYEWFIFDARQWEELFFNNSKLKKEYKDWAQGSKTSAKTDLFYKEIAPKYIKAAEAELSYTWFDIREQEKTIRHADKQNDTKLIALYKLLSPQHLLKLPFANDSNSLDKQFYAELLHIIGLEEYKDKGKKLITRKPEGKRDQASLLEMCIRRLETRNKMGKLHNPSHFGDTSDERIFNVALELCITWMNRVLFLKLLEAQLLSYNNNDQRFKFLNSDFIPEFDELEKLFFDVLAVRPEARKDFTKPKFDHIPYLNSSLFEQTSLEEDLVNITDLDDLEDLPLYSSTVLKNAKGKSLKNGPAMRTMHYLFAFLDAYSFSSEGGEQIQEQNKRLINASVLGLIFEKINGYKDGSFFTPGFITMYMCRETIRRAVVQKFNDTYNWGVDSFDALRDRIEPYDADNRKAYNQLVDSLKICDPAVGSGHFLVSALNELIAIKHDLDILSLPNGDRVKQWTLDIVNDELMIAEKETGDPFQYKLNTKGQAIAELQQLQETLFNQKQHIIENCLFGVDINPNSVKICRLRLWIELLKNAYYIQGSGHAELVSGSTAADAVQQLQTLPNIDINIKEGNSLVSRFALDDSLSKVLKSIKYSITDYKYFVNEYKNSTDKEEKRGFQALIDQIKGNFKSELSKNSKEYTNYFKFQRDLYLKYEKAQLFGESLTKAQKKDRDSLAEKVNNAKAKLDEIENNKIYRNAFEWRFEFPEVLDDEGNYVGFDAIIANPPYIRQEELKEWKEYFAKRFTTYAGTADIYVYFVELGMDLLKAQGGFTYILPNKWMRANYGNALRKFIKQQRIVAIEDFGDLPVFEEATTYPAIMRLERATPTETFNAVNVDTLDYEFGIGRYMAEKQFKVGLDAMQDEGWTLSSVVEQQLLKKIKEAGIPLGKYVDGQIYRGLLTGLNEAFVIDKATRDKLIKADPNSTELIKPFLAGRDIKRYLPPSSNKYLIHIPKGFTIKRNLPNDSPFSINEPPPRYGDMGYRDAWSWFKETYPAIAKHLLSYKAKAEIRTDKGDFWWELRACDYYEEFEKPKIVWPEVSFPNHFLLDHNNFYLNKTCFFAPVDDTYLLGILNSRLVLHYLLSITSMMRGGYLLMSKQYIETIPICSNDNQQPIITLVDQILAAKQADPEADTSAWEAEIDQLVYQLYGLTKEEIRIVEESVG